MIHWWQTLVGEFLIVTAFIGFSATIALLIELSCANQDRQPQKGADHNQAPAPQTADKVEAPSQSMEKKSEGTQTHQNNAGYTQTRAYAFTYLLTQIIICIAAGFGVPIAIITIGSLNDSISAARQQFDLTERPWVLAIHEVGEPLTFQPATGYASFILKETLQNTGESTAINIGSWADIIPESPMDSFQTSLNRQRQYCDAHRTNPDPSRMAILSERSCSRRKKQL
jgi:hypothetical protein